ncbi:D-alanine--poly(phosphoribitol) ligase subunit DltC [Vagococcus sp. DIV0080]|uniref:D-alanyl carrier protein n=1 Tax=Candidatus Vagococcus giribetii TaxID=2230876 RepID=A0ABS3HVX4_9ENTE|nr:D-alanine--poly(phosphoribitol) ligase subunit DltC [Vagococcus sp. DIV0080]MBO0477913.1 D-alanine--poly(phosphoribitol) ligase subunit DltC [Vagococcus sp. DIV0080]
MDIKTTILAIIEDLTGEDVSGTMDLNLYDEGLLDSMATVQMLVEIDGQLGITVPVSEYDRSEWGTPQQIINQVTALA